MDFIDKKEIFEIVDYKELVFEMKSALIDLSKNLVTVPERLHINSKDLDATYLFMPVFSKKLGKVACKYVGVCNDNAKINLSAINGVVMLADAKSGVILSMLDAASLTAVRTAAVSAASIDKFTNLDAKVLSVFGTSAQAETQIYAACSIRDIEKIYIFYRNKEKAEAFVDKIKSNVDAKIELCSDFDRLSESDIIIAATNSKMPVFKLKDVKLKPDVHISAIGSFKPDMQEIGENIYTTFKVFADHKASCIKESGDIIIPMNKGLINSEAIIEIGSILKNDNSNYRNMQTIFKSVGNAAFDLYAANYVLNKC
jgi:ornithine cyclodeaminase